jgi:CMP-N-acetylneuraminic acid synthetase
MHFCGEPLVVRCYRMLKDGLGEEHHVVVNTESVEIHQAMFYSDMFANVFLRNNALAKDSTTTEEILANFCSHYSSKREDKEEGFDYVSVINPTSPLLTANTVKTFLSTVEDNGYDTAFSTTSIKKHLLVNNRPLNYSPFGPHPRTQDVEEVQMLNWSIVTWRLEVVKKSIQKRGDSLYQGKVGFINTPVRESIDIDTQEDFDLAVAIAQSRDILTNTR